MANDPGLAADTCIFMEAVSGDGGTHNSGGAWWLSPDIQLNGPASGPDKADPGVANPVDVTLHNKGGDCKLPPGTESVTIELWAGNPAQKLRDLTEKDFANFRRVIAQYVKLAQSYGEPERQAAE